jgi:protein FrlC
LLEDSIDVVADAGYDGIELGAAAPHAYPDYLTAERRDAVNRHLERRGIAVSALCPAVGGGPGFNSVSPDLPEREAGAEYIEKCLELARDLNCETMIWLAGIRRYGQSPDEAWRLAVEGLQRAAESAERYGVRLVLEATPRDSNVVEDAGDCLRLLNDADVAGGVMLDTFHIYYRNEDIRAALRDAGDRLEYLHLSDTDRTPPGTHHDFGSVIAELTAMGYSGWLSMEIGCHGREDDPDALARDAIGHLRTVLAEYPQASAA